MSMTLFEQVILKSNLTRSLILFTPEATTRLRSKSQAHYICAFVDKVAVF